MSSILRYAFKGKIPNENIPSNIYRIVHTLCIWNSLNCKTFLVKNLFLSLSCFCFTQNKTAFCEYTWINTQQKLISQNWKVLRKTSSASAIYAAIILSENRKPNYKQDVASVQTDHVIVSLYFISHCYSMRSLTFMLSSFACCTGFWF